MARASAIRELAASLASKRIAAALFERIVQIWDVGSGERIAEFDTVFSFGGRRLAIDASGELCVAAGWTRGRRGGVACYEAKTGTLLWHRADLRQTQRICFSHTGTSLWRVPDTGPAMRLDVLTGNTLEEIRGLKSLSTIVRMAIFAYWRGGKAIMSFGVRKTSGCRDWIFLSSMPRLAEMPYAFANRVFSLDVLSFQLALSVGDATPAEEFM